VLASANADNPIPLTVKRGLPIGRRGASGSGRKLPAKEVRGTRAYPHQAASGDVDVSVALISRSWSASERHGPQSREQNRPQTEETAMNQMCRVLSFLVVVAALGSSCSHVLARSSGGGGHPTQVKGSGTTFAPAPVRGRTRKAVSTKYPFPNCSQNPTAAFCQNLCRTYPSNAWCRPGHSQPDCRGPHRGPNGVMIQCD
jgi:hypothetical protein